VAKHHINVGVGHGGPTRCLGQYGGPTRCLGQCGKRIFFGDRCPDCARKLRERKRRKPR
jgi:hypothetical protein